MKTPSADRTFTVFSQSSACAEIGRRPRPVFAVDLHHPNAGDQGLRLRLMAEDGQADAGVWIADEGDVDVPCSSPARTPAASPIVERLHQIEDLLAHPFGQWVSICPLGPDCYDQSPRYLEWGVKDLELQIRCHLLS